MRTNTCYVVILMIFEIHLATTSTTIRPETPPGVGSCQPIRRTELQEIISKTVFNEPLSVGRFRAICTVPGVTRGTVSQYTIYAQLFCIDDCEKPHYFYRFNLMCHNSTESFQYPTIMAYRGIAVVEIDPYDYLNSVLSPGRIKCGRCADLYGRPYERTCYGIIICYYRFELWLISNTQQLSMYKQSTCYRFKET